MAYIPFRRDSENDLTMRVDELYFFFFFFLCSFDAVIILFLFSNRILFFLFFCSVVFLNYFLYLLDDATLKRIIKVYSMTNTLKLSLIHYLHLA